MPRKATQPPKPLPRPAFAVAIMFHGDSLDSPEIFDFDGSAKDLRERIRRRGRENDLPEGAIVMILDSTDPNAARFRNSQENAAHEKAMVAYKQSRRAESEKQRQARAAAAVPA